MATASVAPRHRFTREEYYALAATPPFRDRPVELIRGELVDVSPQKSAHYTSVRKVTDLVTDLLGAAVRPGYEVRPQGPLSLPDDSEPEPDIAVVAGSKEDYSRKHPATALLVVEVAESSLAQDLGEKASVYAEAGIPDYWVLDLVHAKLHVHRDPGPAPGSAFGFAYRAVRVLGRDEPVSALRVPGVRLKVADMLA